MLFVIMFVNKLFIFPGSHLNFFQSCFLKEENVVLISDIILFMIPSIHFFLLWLVLVSLCTWCFGHYYLAFALSFCFSEFSFLVTVSESCWYRSLYLFCWISDISMFENQPFFIIVRNLVSESLVPGLKPNSVHISIILFCRVAPNSLRLFHTNGCISHEFEWQQVTPGSQGTC